jgi:hypothetical protein
MGVYFIVNCLPLTIESRSNEGKGPEMTPAPMSFSPATYDARLHKARHAGNVGRAYKMGDSLHSLLHEVDEKSPRESPCVKALIC